jgi:hypothetical protein
MQTEVAAMARVAVLFGLLLAALGAVPASAQNPCTRVGQEVCQQGEVYRCEKTGSEITPIFQNRKCVVNVPSLVGTWQGVGHQTPAGKTGSDYPVVMNIGGNGGSIDYPSLKCGGSLTRLSGSATSAQYREHITYGNCLDGGTVSVNLFQGRLSWTWTGQQGGINYNVIAVLERR